VAFRVSSSVPSVPIGWVAFRVSSSVPSVPIGFIWLTWLVLCHLACSSCSDWLVAFRVFWIVKQCSECSDRLSVLSSDIQTCRSVFSHSVPDPDPLWPLLDLCWLCGIEQNYWPYCAKSQLSDKNLLVIVLLNRSWFTFNCCNKSNITLTLLWSEH